MMDWLNRAEAELEAFETTAESLESEALGELTEIALDFTEVYGRKLIAAVKLSISALEEHEDEKVLAQLHAGDFGEGAR